MDQKQQPDILIYMSDQHGADYCSWGNVQVDTPVLADMAAHGTRFSQAYSPCPLCVPARMSMMSAQLPQDTGVYNNKFTLSNLTPCFTHSLVEAGYETVLIGRMHFMRRDQRHGFTKRLAGDVTPVSWKKPFGKIAKERGKTVRAFSPEGSTELVGAGDSIVTDYDRYVLETALDYLSEEHEKPQFILVGAFGPHSPYITSPEMYRKYLRPASAPSFFREEELPAYLREVPALNARVRPASLSEEDALACRAAYLGLIETMDGQIGELRSAFHSFSEKRGHGAVFGYVSDHGDMAGERRMYGKTCFFDKSAKIPMLFEGTGISEGKTIDSPVSLLDLGPTVCELGGTVFSTKDARSLAPQLCGQDGDSERVVVSQVMETLPELGACAGTMLRWKNYKYVVYHRAEDRALLFDMNSDPLEEHNLISELPELAAWFSEKAAAQADFSAMEQQFRQSQHTAKLLEIYEGAAGFDDTERWKDNPPSSRAENLEIVAVDRLQAGGR